jgi:hypothetical protein
LKRLLLIGGTIAVALGLVTVLLMAWAGSLPLPFGTASGEALTPQAWPSFYMRRDAQCTVLVDFSEQREAIDGMQADARRLVLAQEMVRELRTNGDTKAGDAKNVQMIAVYIDGKDNYGRPDFARRTNLVKLSGSRETFASLADADLNDWQRLQSALAAETN